MTQIMCAPTWRQINKLLREGFTKKTLAERLGFKNGAIQFNCETILKRNARRVDKLYRMLMVGGY